MSRVAKKPINLPKGVELTIQPEVVSVKGPKGTLSLNKTAGVEITLDNGVATLNPKDISFDALAGTVIERRLTPGEVVEAGRDLMTIADLSAVWVWMSLYERDLARLLEETKKRPARVRIATSAFPGAVKL